MNWCCYQSSFVMRDKSNFHDVERRNYNEACEYPKLSTSSNYIINFEDAGAEETQDEILLNLSHSKVK